MKSNSKYDPEDIESLLLHKQFNELYPEEKEFILQHIETPEEYESLRKTLFDLRDASQQGEWLEPDASLKKDLMAQFVTEEKGGFRVWLNSLFVWPDVQWYRQPALRVAFAGACVIAVAVFFINYNDSTPQNTLAENAIKNSEPTDSNKEQEETKPEEKNLFAENIQQKELPAAPKVSSAVNESRLFDAKDDVSDDINYAHEDAVAQDFEKDSYVPPSPIVTDEKKPASSNKKESVATGNSMDYKDAEAVESTSKTIIQNADANTVTTYSNSTLSGNTNDNNRAMKSITFSSAISRPVSDVSDLFAVLFTAQ